MDSSEYESTTDDNESSSPKKAIHKCTFRDCKASFIKTRKLFNHIRKHTGERPFVCTEPNCDKSYTNSSHLLRHKRTFHNLNRKSFPCTAEGCTKVLSDSFTLKKHLSRIHNSERKYKFQCNECKKGFPKKNQLQVHSAEHTGSLAFPCTVCDMNFATLHLLTRHKRSHTTSYKCDDCSKTFERWTVLLRHRKTCKSEFVCEMCHKKFARQENLLRHLRTHSNSDKSPKFACPHENCQRSYLYKKNLNQHIERFHLNKEAKRIPCPIEGCRQTLAKMQNVQVHLLKVHSANKKRLVEPREPRKDIGIEKKSILEKLTGVRLTYEEHNDILCKEKFTENITEKFIEN